MDDATAAVILGRVRAWPGATLSDLAARHGSLPAVLAAVGRGAAGPSPRARVAAVDRAEVAREIAWAAAGGVRLLTLGGAGYPIRLARLPDPPPALFVRGDAELLDWPQVAIVGARHATAAGRDVARRLAGELAGAGLGVTSGLAVGIDAAAHVGALAAHGVTVAVLGNGLVSPYPRVTRPLADDIAAAGALVSEFGPWCPPRPEHFPRRNRIVSGLGFGVVVVEAAERSGALVTARLALEQGLEVFAVPGSVHNPRARGCHRLLRDGARLVESASDVLEELGSRLPAAPPRRPGRCESAAAEPRAEALSGPERTLLDTLGFDPRPFDALVEDSGLTPEVVSSILVALEIKGCIEPAPGGVFTRAFPGKPE